MRLEITLFGKLQEMKEKMDLVWSDLFKKGPGNDIVKSFIKRGIPDGLRSFQNPKG